MSKKKIIAGIMGTATLITGDGSVSTLTSFSEIEEKKTEKQKKVPQKLEIKEKI